MKVVCKLRKPIASGLQVLHKQFTNSLQVICQQVKPMQILSKLVFQQVFKYKCFRNDLVSKHFLSEALQVFQLAFTQYLRLCKCLSYQQFTILCFAFALVNQGRVQKRKRKKSNFFQKGGGSTPKFTFQKIHFLKLVFSNGV